MRHLEHARGDIVLDRCLVMGIVNRTPDSFYDGGRTDLAESIEHALRLVDEGADILDIGGVRAGPGPEVEENEEIDRLVPLVEDLGRRVDIPLSVETTRAAVAQRALDAGAAIVNDVSGFSEPDLATVCARNRAAVVVMHHGGQIRGRPRNPRYEDVVEDVRNELDRLARMAMAAGVGEAAILVDPGLDFGKTTKHSLALMRRLGELIALPWPVLVAPSRKDVVGETLGLPVEERLEGTLALVALAVDAGAAVVRVHDVAATARVVAMVEAVAGRREPSAPVRGLWE